MGSHIKLFAKEKDYFAGKSELEVPSVSFIDESGKVILSSDPQPPAYVDLGLPSGVKWATMNVGARSIEEAGMYFSWGNVDGHFEVDNINWGWDYYNTKAGHGLSGNIPVNDTYDAARKYLGSPWRMPTKAEFEELNNNCASQWCSVGGRRGRLFISKINGKSIFIPAAGDFNYASHNHFGMAGYYWSSTFDDSSVEYGLYFDSSSVRFDDYYLRCYGFPVRPVKD